MRQLEYGYLRLRRGIGLAGCLLLGCLAVTTTAAGNEQATIEIPVRDENGAKLTVGKVQFCPWGAPIVELDIETDGTCRIDRTVLTINSAYTVLIYAADLTLRYADNYWVYDPTVAVDAKSELTGLPNQGLQVVIPPLPEQLTDVATLEPASPTGTLRIDERPSAFQGAVLMPLMLGGGFGTDTDALGGVSSVAAGFGLTGSYRFGFPLHRTVGSKSVAFHEISFTYAQNRYHVDPIQSADAGSDLTFHRFYLAYGLGRYWGRSQGSLAAAASYGGVYDGGTLVKYRERTYGMFGAGLQARYIHRLLGGDPGLAVGVLGQLELMYYFADAGETDHWYGWAPSVAFGVAVN